jgi:hypothetical protein
MRRSGSGGRVGAVEANVAATQQKAQQHIRQLQELLSRVVGGSSSSSGGGGGGGRVSPSSRQR